jgi:hypothetical protein
MYIKLVNFTHERNGILGIFSSDVEHCGSVFELWSGDDSDPMLYFKVLVYTYVAVLLLQFFVRRLWLVSCVLPSEKHISQGAALGPIIYT